MNHFRALAIPFFLLLTLPLGCTQTEEPQGEVKIVASVPALAWIAQTVAPDAVVTLLVRPGVSPHGFELAPSQAVALRRADIVLLAGGGIEPRSITDALGGADASQVVIRMEELLGADTSEAEHDHAHEHDPHYWLDPGAMRRLAIRTAESTDQSADDAIAAIDAVDSEYAEALAQFGGARVVALHDAWSRLADRYSLDAASSVMAQFELEPTPGAVERAAEALRGDTPAVIVVEPQMDRSVAERLGAVTGAPIVELDPLGTADWPAMMRSNLARLIVGFEAATQDAGESQ